MPVDPVWRASEKYPWSPFPKDILPLINVSRASFILVNYNTDRVEILYPDENKIEVYEESFESGHCLFIGEYFQDSSLTVPA